LRTANEAIRLKPNYPEAHAERAYALVKLANKLPADSFAARHQYGDAVAAYKEALRLQPDLAAAYSGLGDIYRLNLHQYEEGIEAYQQYLRLKPQNAAVQYNLGWSYSELERYAEAVKPLSEAVRLRPEDADALRELGYAYLGLKQFATAAASLKRAISLNPQASLAYYYLGIVDLRMGNKTEALEQYRALQRIDPERAKKLYAEINK
jgi:tetratricopeptide (TPR) repeat protein